MDIQPNTLRMLGYIWAGLAVTSLFTGVFPELLGLTGFALIGWGGFQLLYAVLHQKSRRQANATLFMGILLFTYAWLNT